MSDELKPGAFFDLYGVTADDGGNLDPREPTIVQVLAVETSHVLVEYVTQFSGYGDRLRRWVARALFHERYDEHFAVAAHPIDPSFVVGRMASERDEVRRMQASPHASDLTRYLASVERALTDAQAQCDAGGR